MQLITSDNKPVEVSEVTKKRLEAHPGILELLPEVISKITLNEDAELVKKNIDLGRVVGKSGLVDTPDITENTKTYFAYRKERQFPSHVSMHEEGNPCQTVAVSLRKNKETNSWSLITAFVGKSAPNEPFYYFDKESWFYKDEAQFKESLDFWMKHSLVLEEGVTGEPYESTWKEELEKVRALNA